MTATFHHLGLTSTYTKHLRHLVVRDYFINHIVLALFIVLDHARFRKGRMSRNIYPPLNWHSPSLQC